MSGLSEEAMKVAQGYDAGMAIRGEFEQLESEFVDVDRAEILNFMEASGERSASRAYRKMNGLEAEATEQPADDFQSRVRASLGATEQRKEPYPGNESLNDLSNRMKSFFNRDK